MTTVTLDLSTGAPPSPERTLELAGVMAECARVLNHTTMHHEALRSPADADRLVRELATAASRLPQLLEQVSRWLAAEQSAGRVAGARHDPATAVASARIRLDRARGLAHDLAHSLDFAASVTSGLAAREDGSDE